MEYSNTDVLSSEPAFGLQDLPYFAEQCLVKISLLVSQLRLWPELSLDLQDARPLRSLAALVQSCQCMHRALACCQALATHAGLGLLNQLKNVRVDLDKGFLLFCALVGSVDSNFSQRLLKEASVERINDCEEEVALDVVLAFIGRVWQVLHDFFVRLHAGEYFLDCELRADRHTHNYDLVQHEVALLAS